jgi:CheY-like chemotaxis protein
MSAALHEEKTSSHVIGMVVDDDDLVREAVAAMLEDFCAEVYQASDGQVGLEVLEDHPDIELVVTDISMPRLDGIAFADRARRLHPELKVLFVSGLQQPPPREKFLMKPFMRGALMSAIRHLLTPD